MESVKQELDRLDVALAQTPWEPNLLFTRAELALQLGRFDEAERDLSSAIALKREGRLFLLRAAVRFALDNGAAALEDFRVGFTLDSGSDALDRGIAAARAFLGERAGPALRSVDQLIGSARGSAAAERPSGSGDARTIAMRGLGHVRDNDLERAAQALAAAESLDANEPRVFALRAQIKAAKGDWAGAEADFTEAFARDPADLVALQGRAFTRDRQKSFAGVLEDCDLMIARDPALVVAYSMSGAALMELGQPERARERLDAGLAIAPADRNCRIGRMLLFKARQEWAGVIADGELLLEQDEEDFLTRHDVATAHLESGEPARAEEELTRAIETEPRFAEAYADRAVARRLQGDDAGADADLEIVRNADPALVDDVTNKLARLAK